MNKNILIIIGLLVLVVVGAGIYTLTSKTGPFNKTQIATDKAGQKSLKDLLSSGQAQMCKFKDLADNANYEGSVYIADGRMRGDFTSSANGQTSATHMIAKDNKSYTWIDGQATGFMMEFDLEKMAEEAPNPAGESTAPKSVDINKMIDYDCSGWSVDEGVFTPPSNVKFQDFGEIIVPTGAVQSAPSACKACDTLSGESKTSCRAALKCE